MRVLLGCLMLHALCAAVAPSPWWVPNLTLVGLVMAIQRAPHRWPTASVIAGLFTVLWAVRFPVPLLAGSLGLGALVRWLNTQWDLDDPRVQDVVMTCGSGIISAGLLWLDGLWSPTIAGWVVVHVAVTVLLARFVRRLRMFV